jgi:hypothetical protein
LIARKPHFQRACSCEQDIHARNIHRQRLPTASKERRSRGGQEVGCFCASRQLNSYGKAARDAAPLKRCETREHGT